MARILAAVSMACLICFCAVAIAADSSVAGKWDLTSSGADGQDYSWVLTIKDDGGKLAGTLSGGPGDFTLSDLTYESSTLRCKVVIDDQTYSIEAKVNGDTMEGAYKGPGGDGKIKAKKQS